MDGSCTQLGTATNITTIISHTSLDGQLINAPRTIRQRYPHIAPPCFFRCNRNNSISIYLDRCSYVANYCNRQICTYRTCAHASTHPIVLQTYLQYLASCTVLVYCLLLLHSSRSFYRCTEYGEREGLRILYCTNTHTYWLDRMTSLYYLVDTR